MAPDRVPDLLAEIEDRVTYTQSDDLEWALERVTRLCASAYVDASVYRTKLLKGFGYPDETFRAAQDARALTIVLKEYRAAAEALRQSQEALDVLRKRFSPDEYPCRRCGCMEWEHKYQGLPKCICGSCSAFEPFLALAPPRGETWFTRQANETKQDAQQLPEWLGGTPPDGRDK